MIGLVFANEAHPERKHKRGILQDVQVMRGDTNFRLLVKKKHECSNRIT